MSKEDGPESQTCESQRHMLSSSGLNFAERPEMRDCKKCPARAVLWEGVVSDGIGGCGCSQVFQTTALRGSCHTLVL